MTSEEEEGAGIATWTPSRAASSAATSEVTTAVVGGDGKDAAAPRRTSSHHLLCPEEKEGENKEIEQEHEGMVQGEKIEEEDEEEEMVEGDAEDGSSDTSMLVVPYPELVPVVFFCLKQTTCPRSWCIRMVSNPYPLLPVRDGYASVIHRF